MSNIRRQSLISSAIVYFGFALGFVNTYLFARNFTIGQYGLVSTFVAIANIMFSFASLGMHSFIYKFYPYYNDNLPRRRQDMMTIALTISIAGFVMVSIAGIVLKDFVVRKYITNAPDLIRYYYWLFPFGLGLTIYSILEAYAWQVRQSVLTNFLKEVQFRLLTTLLIVLFFTGVISNFDQFVRVYSMTYLLTAGVLLAFLFGRKKISFTSRISRVTKKFYKKVLSLAGFVWSGGLVFNISNVFDTLVIAAVMQDGLAFAGIYALAQNIASLIQAPQRGIISASIAPLSKAWKDKDYERIRRIYQRSSINQLIFAIGMFALIYLNFVQGVETFSLKQGYVQAFPVFLFIGLMRTIDMGTGLNSQIIGTSTFWRFEFFTGIVLLGITLPLNYLLTRSLGVTGPAIANLVALTVYNAIRAIFLWKKTGMQPFSRHTFYTIAAGLVSILGCHYAFRNMPGLTGIIIRSICFIAVYGGMVVFLKLSPDIMPVLATVRSKIPFVRKRVQSEARPKDLSRDAK